MGRRTEFKAPDGVALWVVDDSDLHLALLRAAAHKYEAEVELRSVQRYGRQLDDSFRAENSKHVYPVFPLQAGTQGTT